MSKQPRKLADGEPPAGSEPTQSEKPEKPPLDPALVIQEHIGRGLRDMFEEVVAQPVPEKFRKLLEELARKQPKD